MTFGVLEDDPMETRTSTSPLMGSITVTPSGRDSNPTVWLNDSVAPVMSTGSVLMKSIDSSASAGPSTITVGGREICCCTTNPSAGAPDVCGTTLTDLLLV